MGKFVIFKAKNGEYTFRLEAGNGEPILAAGETFSSLAACKGSVESVKKNANAHVEDQTKEGYETLKHPKYELYKNDAGQFRFRLKAINGEPIGRSEGYKAKASAVNGIESVGRNAPDADVVVEE